MTPSRGHRGGRRPPMVKRRPRPGWHLLFTAGGLLAAVAVGLWVGRTELQPALPEGAGASPAPTLATGPRAFADSVAAQADTVLAELGIRAAWIDRRPAVGGVDTVGVRVPGDLPLASVNLALTEMTAHLGGRVVRGLERQSGTAVDLTIGFDTVATTLFRLRRHAGLRRRAGRLAIVVYGDLSDTLLARAAAVPQPLTVALPPGRQPPESAAAAHEWRGPGRWPALALADTLVVGAEGTAGVRRWLWAMAERAADRGQAVGVVSAGPETFAALEAVLPQLERRGYRFVTLTQLAAETSP